MVSFQIVASGPASWGINYKWDYFPIKIIEVDVVNRNVLASWNCNPSKWYPEQKITKYRANLPKK